MNKKSAVLFSWVTFAVLVVLGVALWVFLPAPVAPVPLLAQLMIGLGLAMWARRKSVPLPRIMTLAVAPICLWVIAVMAVIWFPMQVQGVMLALSGASLLVVLVLLIPTLTKPPLNTSAPNTGGPEPTIGA